MRIAIVVLAGSMLDGCAARSSPAPSTISWSAPIEIASGGGEKGPWQQNNSRFDYVDDPSVALMPDGAAAVVWTDHRTKDIHFQIYERDGRPRLARAPNISGTPAVFSWLPRLAVSGRDVYVLWQEIVFSGGTHGGDAFFARSTDGGATFEQPRNLSRSKNGDGKGRLDAKIWDNGSLDLVVADDGTLHAAWTEYDGPLWVSRSDDRGQQFSAPVQVGGTATEPARAPTLAARGAAVYLAWTVGEDRRADIRIARSDDGGRTFGAPAIVARTPGYSDAPKLAIDTVGTVHLVYSESERDWRERPAVFYTRSRAAPPRPDLQGPPASRGPEPAPDISQTLEPTPLAFEPPRRLSPAGAAFPSLALDGDHVYASWEVLRDGELPRGLALTYSLDGGDRFNEPRIIAGSVDPGGGWNGSHQGRLMRKLDVRDGTIAIVNSALEHGDHSRVWLVRGQRASDRVSRR